MIQPCTHNHDPVGMLVDAARVSVEPRVVTRAFCAGRGHAKLAQTKDTRVVLTDTNASVPPGGMFCIALDCSFVDATCASIEICAVTHGLRAARGRVNLAWSTVASVVLADGRVGVPAGGVSRTRHPTASFVLHASEIARIAGLSCARCVIAAGRVPALFSR